MASCELCAIAKKRPEGARIHLQQAVECRRTGFHPDTSLAPDIQIFGIHRRSSFASKSPETSDDFASRAAQSSVIGANSPRVFAEYHGRIVMADLVLIPFPGLGTLAMTREQFESALAAGSSLGTVAQSSPGSAAQDELVDADNLERRTGVPASWWMARAREGRIPFRKIGRRVRFDAHEVLNSSAFLRRAPSAGSYHTKPLER
jgi:hypothetical protein